jgi:beta-mannanase
MEGFRPVYTTDIYAHKIGIPGLSDIPDDDNIIPGEFHLSQNYPNPFNPSTIVQYTVPQSSRIIVKIYNALGQDVITLLDEYKEAGVYNLRWNAAGLSSGVYFCRLTAGVFASTRKMTFMK